MAGLKAVRSRNPTATDVSPVSDNLRAGPSMRMSTRNTGVTSRHIRVAMALIAGALLATVLADSAVAGKPGGGVVVTRRYSFEIIAPLGTNRMFARGMNEHGDVVGNSRPATGSDTAFISAVQADG